MGLTVGDLAIILVAFVLTVAVGVCSYSWGWDEGVVDTLIYQQMDEGAACRMSV